MILSASPQLPDPSPTSTTPLTGLTIAMMSRVHGGDGNQLLNVIHGVKKDWPSKRFDKGEAYEGEYLSLSSPFLSFHGYVRMGAYAGKKW